MYVFFALVENIFVYAGVCICILSYITTNFPEPLLFKSMYHRVYYITELPVQAGHYMTPKFSSSFKEFRLVRNVVVMK